MADNEISQETKPQHAATPTFLMNMNSYSLKTVIMAVLINIAVTVCGIAIYDHYFTQKFVVLDIDSYADEQKRLFYTGKINKDEFLGGIEELRNTINDVNPNTIILTRAAVLKNGTLLEPKK